MLQDRLYGLLEAREQDMIEMRRYLHRHPEPSFREFKTAEYIRGFYDKYGGGDIELRYPVGLHGIAVRIKGGSGVTRKKTLAIRADFDALELTEQTGLEYSSVNPGVMHACGHDAHTAVLLAVADALIKVRHELAGDILILHQYAEETSPGGATAMIDDGVLDGVDAIIGGHMWASQESGWVAARPGMAMAGRSYFKAVITGSGGHGSQPQACIDPILAASHFVVAAQSIISRSVNPLDSAVVTIGRFEGHGSFNIIPGSVMLEGDARYFTDEVKSLAERRFRELLAGVSAAHGCGHELDYYHDYPATVNDAGLAGFASKFIERGAVPGLKLREIDPTMGSEDFSCYQREIPGLYVFFGTRPDGEVYPHHHPKFNIGEGSLLDCAKFYAGFAVDFLANYEI